MSFAEGLGVSREVRHERRERETNLEWTELPPAVAGEAPEIRRCRRDGRCDAKPTWGIRTNVNFDVGGIIGRRGDTGRVNSSSGKRWPRNG